MADGEAFSVEELADAVTGGDEHALRQLLNDMGGHLEVYASRPSEQVPRALVAKLAETRAGDRVGRRLAELLGRRA
jgi:hypothetical protein